MGLHNMLSYGTTLEAEIYSITIGISDVINRWAALDEYFEKLLAEDFMNPREYAKLLFDDESFSRSQKYFWTIGSLNEFVASLTDNIKQLTLYYEARIKPLLLRPDLAKALDAMCLTRDTGLSAEKNGAQRVDQFKKLVADFESKRVSLVSLQSQFSGRVETVKTLREGVSSLSECKSIGGGSFVSKKHSDLVANS
jgi:hypothetical protein